MYSGIVAIKKKRTVLSFVTIWMNNLKGIMLSEVSQEEKVKYCMILFTGGI